MGFWHTGYAEFHEPSGLEGLSRTPPAPVRYACELCSQSFASVEELRRHRFEHHPLRQPALYVRGRAVGSLPLAVRSALSSAEVAVEDAARCTVNGRSVPPAKLGSHLARMTREFVEVELENLGVVTRCKLDFRIAPEAALMRVEEAFLRMARNRVLNIDALERFIADCRETPEAMSYCNGISNYLYGVMAKERSRDSGLKHEQFVERFLRAEEELSGFDRALARNIRALVAFHFNHFEEAEFLAPPNSPLQNAAGSFASLLQGLPWHYEEAFTPVTQSPLENLLTDQDTLQLLSDASQGLVELKARSADLQDQLRRPSAGYDRLKRVLLTCEALAEKDDDASRSAAIRLAREMATKPDTQPWAEAMLERLKRSQ